MLKKPSREQWITAAWIGGFVICAALVALIAAVVVVSNQLPELDEITHYQPRQPLEIVTREGLELAQFGPERRRFLPVGEFPDVLKNALIATEDADFRNHSGISLKGIARAAVSNLLHHHRQGASTITQQVARNFFLSRKQTWSRKFAEALLALKIERHLSKDQILELYMNQIYLGQHAYGFEAASLTYFGKPSKQLTAAEAAMLAGLPKNPGGADPTDHFEKAKARQLVVLMRMHETGVLDDAQYEAAKKQPLKITGHWTPPVVAEYLAEMVRQQVVQRFGEAAYSQGLKVTTSLVSADQAAAQAAVRKGVIDFDRRQAWRGPEDNEDLPDSDADIDTAAAAALHDHPDDDDLRVAVVTHATPKEVVAVLASGETLRLTGDALRGAGVLAALRPKAPEELAITRGAIIRVMRTTGDASYKSEWRLTQWPDVEGALVSLDSNTGQVRALVGGFDFSHSQFNHVTSAWRQPGSSFKPFIYSAALEHGIQPATQIMDAPISIDDALTGGRHWDPKDDDEPLMGPISLRSALAKSKNLVSIRVVQNLGTSVVKNWAAQFGLSPDKQPDNLTLSLGAGSVTPMQQARAYAAFANGGFGVTPRFIEKITDAQGKVLFEAPKLPDTPPEDARIIPARNAFVMASLLNEVARTGTAAKAQSTLKRPDLYGKTGTTNDAVDTWFAGFQPKVTTVVWMGRDDNTSLGGREFGATLALPIWIDYMRQVLKDVPIATMPTPPGVQDVQGDWLYDEFVGGGYISYLGMEPGNPPSVMVAGAPRDAASQATIDATPMQPTSPGAMILQPAPPPPPAPVAKPRPAPSSPSPSDDPFSRLAPALR
ncbi:MAG: PBP1A family penicillin-binding protein [Burkholderiales bacterium]|nr:PBP1A family penicillin-binding protein [Burkholderiales bacterium]